MTRRDVISGLLAIAGASTVDCTSRKASGADGAHLTLEQLRADARAAGVPVTDEELKILQSTLNDIIPMIDRVSHGGAKLQ